MIHILVIGDSEVVAFRRATEELERRYLATFTFDAVPGRSIIDSNQALRQIFERHIDVVFVLGLTCYFWHKVPMICSPHVKLVTNNPNVRLESVSQFMQEAYHFCSMVNPWVKMYLVLPSVKNIYNFNVSIINKKYSSQAKQLLSDMDKDFRFARTHLVSTARRIYSDQQLLHSEEYSWSGKNILMIHHALNHFVRDICRGPTRWAPHVKFLKGLDDNFNFSEMVSNGLHYMPHCIIMFFESIEPYCRWLRVRSSASALPCPTSESLPAPEVVTSSSSPVSSVVEVKEIVAENVVVPQSKNIREETELAVASGGQFSETESTSSDDSVITVIFAVTTSVRSRLTVQNSSLSSADKRRLWFYLKGVERLFIAPEVPQERRSVVCSVARDMLNLIESEDSDPSWSA
ncbi:UNVERIFIED_CONTAM: hypothetical protein RMT77_009462 [Armadillidium vulgare]